MGVQALNQRPLFTPPAADGALTERQQIVYRAVREQGGIHATEVGQILHREKHDGSPCNYCYLDGWAVLVALRKRKLVTRKHSGEWVPARHGASTRGYDPATAPFPDGF